MLVVKRVSGGGERNLACGGEGGRPTEEACCGCLGHDFVDRTENEGLGGQVGSKIECGCSDADRTQI